VMMLDRVIVALCPLQELRSQEEDPL
jgi:hypothetical protein